MSIDYLEDAFQELLREDGLLVMAKGLGLQRIIARFLRFYAEQPTALVICLRLASPEDHQLIQDALLAEGMDPELLPRVVTNELPAGQREALYKKGGVYLVTSRILIVDILSGKLLPSQISGMLVNQADRVTEASTEAFIVRKYRQANRKGFLKAFADDPEPLLRGFAKVERVLKHLYLKRLYIWPRFHASVKDCLVKRQPEVVELAQALPPAMKAIQQAVLVAMDQCLTELKRTTNLDVSELTLENGIFKAFDALVRNQLAPEWHRISAKTKQVVQDLKILRSLLDYLLRYDAMTFYTFLISIQRANSQQRYPSQWLHSEAANRLFQHAKFRIYRALPAKKPTTKGAKGKDKAAGASSGSGGGGTEGNMEEEGKEAGEEKGGGEKGGGDLTLRVVLEENPKWRLLKEVLQEVREEASKDGEDVVAGVGGARVLVLVRDDHTCNQLSEYLRHGGPAMMTRRFIAHLTTQLGLGKGEGGGRKKGKRFSSGGGREALAEAERELLAEELTRLTGGEEAGEGVGKGRKGGRKRKKPEREGEDEGQGLARVQEIFEEIMPDGPVNVLAEDSPDPEVALPPPSPPATSGRGRKKGAKAKEEVELIVTPIDPVHIVMYTYAQAYQKMCLLSELLPLYIILYDPDTQFVREIEVHQATRPRDEKRIRVYFMVYEDSVEEQRYLTTLKREKEAFEKLIHEKKHMVMPAEVFERTSADDKFAALVADSRARKTGKAPPCTKVVVDVREFRSSLPNLLDLAGLSLYPATLEIGDFILTPEISVERKSVSDLFGSFASGRLYTQVETMLRFYKVPTLLIEFQPDKAFALQTVGEISGDIHLNNIISKLVLLTLKFTDLRILWSRSSYATVELFKDLKSGNSPVDVQKALTAGGGATDEEETLGRNVAAEEVLLRLPGVNHANYRLIMRKVESLSALAVLSEAELKDIMESEPNAKLLYAFFNNPSVPEAPPAAGRGAGGGNGKKPWRGRKK